MVIRRVLKNKERYLPLLLLADEQEEMIERYLERGTMFTLFDKGLRAVCIVTEESLGCCELKNIAVLPKFQRQGYGKRLIGFLDAYYAGKYEWMYVGTGDVPSTINFYRSCGFHFSHRCKDFFLKYDHPIIEDGILLTDMVYLKKLL